MKKINKTLIYDGVMIVFVVGLFAVLDLSLSKLEQVPFYYDYLITAKWLLIAGFSLHGAINWWLSR